MLTKKITYLFLLTFALINIILRYPNTLHEVGVDSFQVHTLANSIIDYGESRWVIHPLSFIGIYPMSQESGGPFVLATFSLLTGINMEYTILLVPIYLSIVALLSSFMFGRALYFNSLFACILAICYSSSRLFLGFTDWTFSTRGIFISMLPIFLYSVIRLWDTQIKISFKNIFLIIMLLFVLICVHKLFFFLSLFLITFLLLFYIRGKSPKFFDYNTSVFINSYLLLISIIFILVITGYLRFGEEQRGGVGYLDSTILDEEIDFLFFQNTIPLINLAIYYSNGIGFLSLFFPVGFFYLLYNKFYNITKEFTLIIFLLSVTFVMDVIYFRTFFTFILSLAVSIGIFATYKHINYKSTTTFGSLFLFLIIFFFPILPEFVTFQEVEKVGFDDNDINSAYNTGIYIRHENEDTTLLFGDHSGRYTTAAYAGELTTHDFNTDILIHETLPPEMLQIDYVYSFEALTKGEKQIYIARDWYVEGNYDPTNRQSEIEGGIYDSPIISDYLLKPYDPKYFFQTNDYQSTFTESVNENAFKIFTNEIQSGWYLYP
tara:strand:+ start:1400 stop:3040 length:1641 start_codon:yes stop_codon:yes gene_type:complete